MNLIHPHSGSFVIGQLGRFGSNLDEKHEMTFWLYFPTEELARQAWKSAVTTGLTVEIVPSENDQWLCLIVCPHVPDEALIDGVMEFCITLASEFGGQFDGWESELHE